MGLVVFRRDLPGGRIVTVSLDQRSEREVVGRLQIERRAEPERRTGEPPIVAEVRGATREAISVIPCKGRLFSIMYQQFTPAVLMIASGPSFKYCSLICLSSPDTNAVSTISAFPAAAIFTSLYSCML
jgi:hypothetical protein